MDEVSNRLTWDLLNINSFTDFCWKVLWLAACFSLFLRASSSAAANHTSAEQAIDSGDSLCEKCHADVVSNYEKTSMARASGLASVDALQGKFFHSSSEVSYRVQEE